MKKGKNDNPTSSTIVQMDGTATARTHVIRGIYSSLKPVPIGEFARYLALLLAMCALSYCDMVPVTDDGAGSPTNARRLHLPPGHGLPVGRIEIPANAYAEYANVLISCPGYDTIVRCVIVVAPDGTATYSLSGSVPHITTRVGDYWSDNETAEDLADYWDDPQAIAAVMGMSGTSRSTDNLQALSLEIGKHTSRIYQTMFRNIRPQDVQIIGERERVIYGHWTGGPAGTLDIEFDYRYASFLDSSARSAIERAGKAWSYRILAADTRLVFIQYERDGCGGAIACASSHTHGYESALGSIIFTKHLPSPGNTQGFLSPWNPFLDVSIHEIGHLFNVPPLDGPYVNREDGTFDGPMAQSANGGDPVPYRRHSDDDDSINLPIGTPGAVIDYAHLDSCVDSVMAYYGHWCHDEGYSPEIWSQAPTEVDFAILTDSMMYRLLDVETASKPEIYGYGAWGEYAAWGVGVARTVRFSGHGHWHNASIYQGDILWATADAFGSLTSKSLIANSTLDGTVVWSGSLLGIDRGKATSPPVVGDAELYVDLASLRGVVRILGLATIGDGTPSAGVSLEYVIKVSGNSFSDSQGHVHGSFYGPGHEEVVVEIDDGTDGGNLLAVFGGKR